MHERWIEVSLYFNDFATTHQNKQKETYHTVLLNEKRVFSPGNTVYFVTFTISILQFLYSVHVEAIR